MGVNELLVDVNETCVMSQHLGQRKRQSIWKFWAPFLCQRTAKIGRFALGLKNLMEFEKSRVAVVSSLVAEIILRNPRRWYEQRPRNRAGPLPIDDGFDIEIAVDNDVRIF